MNVGELLQDKRILGGLAVVVLLVGGYFGMGMIPEGSGKLKTAYADLVKIHNEIEDKAKANPPEKEWTEFGKKTKERTKKISTAIAPSKHKDKTAITSAKSALDSILSAKKPDEIDKKLKEAEKKMDAAKKKLGL